MFYESDLLAIHEAIHGSAGTVTLSDGNSYPVTANKQKCRQVMVGGVNVMVQNTTKSSKWADMAKKGSKITWVIRPGKWGQVVDGKVVKLVDPFQPGTAPKPTAKKGAVKKPLEEDGAAGSPPSKKKKNQVEEDEEEDSLPEDDEGEGGARWYWSSKRKPDEASWTMYDTATTNAIEAAFHRGEKSVKLKGKGGAERVIDFASMQQTNVRTKNSRPVKRVGPTPASSVELDLGKATFKLVDVEYDTAAFWALEETFNAHIQGRNEDYVEKRLVAGKKPVSFVLKAAQAIKNKVLEDRFKQKKAAMATEREAKQLRERVAFHGTHPKHLDSLCTKGLLPFGHEHNPCKTQVDTGYFGSNKKGVYVSRYADYTFKYANRLMPLVPGDTCKVVMFKCLPGKDKHIAKMVGPIDPTDGFDSHSSPSYLEWYLFSPEQCCPSYLLTVVAREDTRTAADDK